MRKLKIASFLFASLIGSHTGFAMETDYASHLDCTYGASKEDQHMAIDFDKENKTVVVTTREGEGKGVYSSWVETKQTRLKGYTHLKIETEGTHGSISLSLVSGPYTFHAFGWGKVKGEGMDITVTLSCKASSRI